MLDSIYKPQKEEVKSEATSGVFDRGKKKIYLTDNEIRDIRKYLESGIPLSDKYRFLLFEDKREVELVWNGKTNEVTNIVLPFQTIELLMNQERKKMQNFKWDFLIMMSEDVRLKVGQTN